MSDEAALRNLESQPAVHKLFEWVCVTVASWECWQFSRVAEYVRECGGEWVALADVERCLLAGLHVPLQLSLLVHRCGSLANVLRRQSARFNLVVSDDAICLAVAAAAPLLCGVDARGQPPTSTSPDDMLTDANADLMAMAWQMGWNADPIVTPLPPPSPLTVVQEQQGMCGQVALPPAPSSAWRYVCDAATWTDSADNVCKLRSENATLRVELQRCLQQARTTKQSSGTALRAAKQEGVTAAAERAAAVVRFDDLRRSKQNIGDKLHCLQATHAELQSSVVASEQERNRLTAEVACRTDLLGAERRRSSESSRRAEVAEQMLVEMRRRVETTALRAALDDAVNNSACVERLLGKLRLQPRSGLLQAAVTRFELLSVRWSAVAQQLRVQMGHVESAFDRQTQSVRDGARLADLPPVVVAPLPTGPAIPNLDELLPTVSARTSEPSVRGGGDGAGQPAMDASWASSTLSSSEAPPPVRRIDQLKALVGERLGRFDEQSFRLSIPLVRQAVGGSVSGQPLKRVAELIATEMCRKDASSVWQCVGVTDSMTAATPALTQPTASVKRLCCVCHEGTDWQGAPLEQCRACATVFHHKARELFASEASAAVAVSRPVAQR